MKRFLAALLLVCAPGLLLGVAHAQAPPGAAVVPYAWSSGGASYTHVAAGQATTTIKSGAGTLYALILNSAATASNITTLYDNTAGSGAVIGIPTATAATAPVTLTFGTYGLAFATGLTIVTGTANGSDMTVIWK